MLIYRHFLFRRLKNESVDESRAIAYLGGGRRAVRARHRHTGPPAPMNTALNAPAMNTSS